MTPDKRSPVPPLAIVYGLASIMGLVVVVFCIVQLRTNPRAGFFDALFANWTSTTLVVDMLIAAAATIVWGIIEAKRMDMRWAVWLVLFATTPFAFSLPMFLAFRERKLAQARRS